MADDNNNKVLLKILAAQKEENQKTSEKHSQAVENLTSLKQQMAALGQTIHQANLSGDKKLKATLENNKKTLQTTIDQAIKNVDSAEGGLAIQDNLNANLTYDIQQLDTNNMAIIFNINENSKKAYIRNITKSFTLQET